MNTFSPVLGRNPQELSSIKIENPPHQAMWNDKIEKTVHGIGESSKSYKHMHIDYAQRTSKMFSIYTILGILLGPLAGIISTVDASMHPDEDPTFSIVIAILSSLSGVVVAIVKFGNYEELSSAHKNTAAKYTSLESNVRRQLALYRNDRIPAQKYLSWIGKSFDDLFMAAPLLPENIQKKHANIAKTSGLIAPTPYKPTIQIDSKYEHDVVTSLINNNQIEINTSLDKSDMTTDDKETKIILKTVRRGESLAQFPELSKYSDGQMSYEMTRMMMGFK